MEHQPVNYYAVLGVARTATAGDIRAAYRARVVACHPDHSPSPNAHEVTTLVNEAWHVLGDPERRRLYDATLVAPEDAGGQSSDSGGDSGAAERVAWSCGRCGRGVPRYVDQCRCGQQRPRSKVRSRPDDGGRDQAAGQPGGTRTWWVRVASAAAAVLISQQCFFSHGPDVPPAEPAAVEVPAAPVPALGRRAATRARAAATEVAARAKARSDVIRDRLEAEDLRQQQQTDFLGLADPSRFSLPSSEWGQQMQLEMELDRLARARVEQMERQVQEQWQIQQRLNQFRH